MPQKTVLAKFPKLHDIPPSETAGRETIARYQAQFRAAAFKCLSLLENDPIDRIYCDFQDDFVARVNKDGEYFYDFYQVKTKGKLNHQWSTNEIFGLTKKNKIASPEKIANSFAGKLLVHTVKFQDSCGTVIFLTNVHFNDDIENCLKAFENDDLDNLHYKLLCENFNSAFISSEPLQPADIRKAICKLKFEGNITYLSPDNSDFNAIARETIFKYSEIDLQHGESEEIINNLIALVERKSFKKLIESINEDELDDIAGIGITEMLEILCISKGAYNLLKEGGDPNAIKNASIIHRLFSQANASELMIEFASRCKVDWDFWFRNKRHTMADFDINFIQESINKLASKWASQRESLDVLQEEIDILFQKIQAKKISSTLTRELLLGAVFSSIVRSESQ
jgi:hypothetical protein